MGLGSRRTSKHDDSETARSLYVGVEDSEAKAAALAALAAELDRAPSYVTASGEGTTPMLSTSALRARADIAQGPAKAALTLVAQELEARKHPTGVKADGLRIRAAWLRERHDGV